MPAHSRPKDGMPSHAYVAGIHVFTIGLKIKNKDVDGRDEPGHDGETRRGNDRKVHIGHSAACRDGGRIASRPSTEAADIVVRTMSRASCAGQGRPRCIVALLSHMTTSPVRQLCT